MNASTTFLQQKVPLLIRIALITKKNYLAIVLIKVTKSSNSYGQKSSLRSSERRLFIQKIM